MTEMGTETHMKDRRAWNSWTTWWLCRDVQYRAREARRSGRCDHHDRGMRGRYRVPKDEQEVVYGRRQHAGGERDHLTTY